MLNVLMIAAAQGLLSLGSPLAQAQKIDAEGRCRGKSGKFAKAALPELQGTMRVKLAKAEKCNLG